MFTLTCQVMEASQRKDCLVTLNKHLDSFPQPFCTGKVLTGLLNAFEFSNAGVTILEPLFKVACTHELLYGLGQRSLHSIPHFQFATKVWLVWYLD